MTDFDNAADLAEGNTLCASIYGGLGDARKFLTGEMFRMPRNETLWNRLVAMEDGGSLVNPQTVLIELQRAKELHGGLSAEYFNSIVLLGTTRSQAAHYAVIARTEYFRRSGLGIATRLMQGFSTTNPDDLPEVAAKLLKEMETLVGGDFGTTARRRKLILTPASDIEMRPTRWLWDETPDNAPPTSQGRFPVDSLVLAAGKPGLGKSQFGVWMTAKLTRGLLPGCYYGQPKSVIYAATEDSWEMTLAPRLKAAGADMTKVYRIDVEDVENARITLPRDISALGEAVQEYDVVLLVLDPLLSALDANVNDYRAKEVRAALEPLVEEAQRSHFTILGLAHFNKNSLGLDPLDAISGSNGFGALARAAVAFARLVRDEDEEEIGGKDLPEEFVMSLIKNNLGRLNLPSHKYVIEPVTIPTPTGNAYTSRFVVTGEADTSVREMLRIVPTSAAPKGNKEDQAWQWIIGFLADEPRKRVDIETGGKAEGHASRTIERALKAAKDRGDAITESVGFGANKIAWWGLPGHEDAITAKKTQSRHTHTRGENGESGGNGGTGSRLTVVADYSESPADGSETAPQASPDPALFEPADGITNIANGTHPLALVPDLGPADSTEH